jgi:L-ascorbate metabolism protein UlaG (beta-lactamase superfamily)
MEVQFYGANCVRLSSKKASIVIDDNLADLGVKSITKPGEISLFTGKHGALKVESKIIIDQPGEYEVSGVSIQGIPARAHIDEEGTHNATIYKIDLEDVRIAVVGHVYPELDSEQLEELNTIDLLIIPVGGNGYTLDPVGALKLIKDIEPKIVIPTHYDDTSVKYEVPQQPLAEAIKGLAMEVGETTSKLKVRESDLSDVMRLVILEKQ